MNLYKWSWWLLVIGGLNLGFMGLAGVNVIGYLGDSLTKVIYILVGVSAVYMLAKMKK